MAFQTGVQTLASGQTTCSVNFPTAFSASSLRIFLEVYDSAESADPQLITAQVTSRSSSGFSAKLSAAPSTGTYRLSWLAGSEDVSLLVSSPPSGLAYESLPLYSAPSLPDAATVPVVVPGNPTTTNRVAWGNLKQLSGNSHTHTVSQISDINEGAKTALRSATAEGTRIGLGAAPISHPHPVADLSNASALAKDILVQTTAIQIRDLIDAPAKVHTHTATQISDSTALGRTILTASSPGDVNTALGLTPSAYITSVEDFEFESFIEAFLEASTPADARDQIEAMGRNRFNGAEYPAVGTINLSAFGVNQQVIVINDPGNFTPKLLIVDSASSSFEKHVAITPTTTVALQAGSGVSVFTETGAAAFSAEFGSSSLPAGYYVFRCFGNGSVYISNRHGLFGRQLMATQFNSTARDLLAYNINNLPGVGATGLLLAQSANAATAKGHLAITTSDVSGISAYMRDSILGLTGVAGLKNHLAITVGDITNMSGAGRDFVQRSSVGDMKEYLAITGNDIDGAGATGRSLLNSDNQVSALAALNLSSNLRNATVSGVNLISQTTYAQMAELLGISNTSALKEIIILDTETSTTPIVSSVDPVEMSFTIDFPNTSPSYVMHNKVFYIQQPSDYSAYVKLKSNPAGTEYSVVILEGNFYPDTTFLTQVGEGTGVNGFKVLHLESNILLITPLD
jgi:hypothetical protein